MSIVFRPKPKNYSKTLATRKKTKVYYRVGIVKPHGHYTRTYLGLFTGEDVCQHFENSAEFGGWVTEGQVAVLPDFVPSYVGGPPFLTYGKSESQASIRRRLG
jgi:hypothetical protein